LHAGCSSADRDQQQALRDQVGKDRDQQQDQAAGDHGQQRVDRGELVEH